MEAFRRLSSALLALLIFATVAGAAHSASEENNLPAAIARIKPSIVAVGTYQAARVPAFQFAGTGFAVGDGTLIATNSHVVTPAVDATKRETYAIAVPQGSDGVLREATIVARDLDHDLVLLKIKGPSLPATTLGNSREVREGQLFGLIGFPIGSILGLFPTTHRAMISTITPIAIAQTNARQLDATLINRLRTDRYKVFQLDATAYPGNSGSPLFDPNNGEVVAIVNMVFVKGTKEAALTNPTGITYAIPIEYLHEFLAQVPGGR